MGRRKIEIKPITEERNRSVTFIKRKGGLFKKAHELAVLCQVEIALVIITPDRKVHEYCTAPSVEDITRRGAKYPIVEHKGLRDYDPHFSGDGRHSGDNDAGEEESDGDIDDSAEKDDDAAASTGIPVHSSMLKNEVPDHLGTGAGISEGRSSSRPRLKVQIPLIPAIDTPHPQGRIAKEHGVADGRKAGEAVAVPAQQQQQDQQQLQLQQTAVSSDDSGIPANGAAPASLSKADKTGQQTQAQAEQPAFPNRFNANTVPPSPGGVAGVNPAQYVPYPPGYYNNYPVGYGYPPPSAYPGGSSKPSASGNPMAGTQATVAAAAAAGQRPNAGTGLTPGGANGRWSGYPQSPMTYYVPAPMSGGDNPQMKLEPGMISAAMPSRYMNDMLASPSNYFSMEWGVWDPQASAVPGGTARVSPGTAHATSAIPGGQGISSGAPGGSGASGGEPSMPSPVQFVPVSGNERKRTAVEDENVPKWRQKE